MVVLFSRKPSPTESPLLFEIDDKPLEETLTPWGRVPLVVQAFRSLGVPARVRQHVQIKQRERGSDEATMVESFVVLNAVGGECLDDFQHLRDDAGLKEMLGYEMPSPESARQFLNRFFILRRSWNRPETGGRRSRSLSSRNRPMC